MSPPTIPHRARIRRLDSPTGVRVAVLGPAGEGYSHVKSLTSGISYETPTSRIIE